MRFNWKPFYLNRNARVFWRRLRNMNQDYLYCIEISQSFISDTTEKGIRNDSTRLCVKKPAVLLQRVFFFFLWTFLYSHLCPPGRMPGICLSVSLFNVSDVLDQSLARVPAAWTSQGEQVERETESLEKAQLSEIQCRGLRRCQTLSLCLTFC